MDEDYAPSQIVPEAGPKRTFGQRLAGVGKSVTTRKGLLGDYDCMCSHIGAELLGSVSMDAVSRRGTPPLSGLANKMLLRCIPLQTKSAVHEEAYPGLPVLRAQ